MRMSRINTCVGLCHVSIFYKQVKLNQYLPYTTVMHGTVASLIHELNRLWASDYTCR